ncbi:MAG: glycosyltransferase family 1 protein [Chloroflexota bacterium]|nr:MAG: glycosyltransferase family 1 protein [Chloroflexota bacterium]
MKIAIATGTFHPESGGPPTYLHRLGQELVSRGHAVRLLTFGENSGDRYVHPVTRVSRRLLLPARLIAYTAHLAGLMSWADVTYISDYGLPAAVLGTITGRHYALKIVGDFAWESAVRRGYVPSNTSIDNFQTNPGRSIRVAALRGIQRFYASRAREIIVPSRYLADLVAGWGMAKEKIHVVHNAVDLDAYNAPIGREEARTCAGVAGPTILTICRLTAWKGLHFILPALAELRAFPDACLLHCGEGPEEAALRELAESLGLADRVRFLGRVARDEILTYLRAADVFVLYSGYEGLPHVVLEAMAAGTPVIVSDRGGNVEVVSDGVTGLVVPYERADLLGMAIETVLTDRTSAERRAITARDFVAERFSWPRLVDHTLGIIERTAMVRSAR